MKKAIIFICLVILIAGLSVWFFKYSEAEAGRVVFRRKVIFSAACGGAAGYTYGDSSAYRVLVTATGAGTNMKYLWNGSTSTDSRFIGGEQSQGGIDDCGWDPAAAGGAKCTLTNPSNWIGGKPYGTSTEGWTACDAPPGGNNGCGTGDSNADAKDNSTGLVWSLPCGGSGTTCTPTNETTPTSYTWSNAKSACSNMSGWYLPHQKQLMQAYINGSYGNLESLGTYLTYWSATSVSSNLPSAWYSSLSNGFTTNGSKTVPNYVRCVRSAI